ncbi:hypothetical protein [Prevotella sp. RM4]|uniref:hypothetical protein n=1 Tax=Prevotella sp. RM4 TaxID=1200547 RepID=UPI0018DBD8C2|nr:hypothetical protein [Prevotella sp. RM4]
MKKMFCFIIIVVLFINRAMRLRDLFNITNGNLSICDVMLGDSNNEQRVILTQKGITSEEWGHLNDGEFSKTINDDGTNYLTRATLLLKGISITQIAVRMEFSSFPNSLSDSFLGIAKEMEEYGVVVIKPQWKVLKDKITNQYKIHNPLWDVVVNIKIVDKGTTYITLSLTANLIDNKGQIAEEAIGVYRMASELVRKNRQIEDYNRNHPQGTIFF